MVPALRPGHTRAAHLRVFGPVWLQVSGGERKRGHSVPVGSSARLRLKRGAEKGMTTLPIPYVEQHCTIHFGKNGQTYTSGGAVVTQDYAIGYVCRHTPGTEPDGRYYGG